MTKVIEEIINDVISFNCNVPTELIIDKKGDIKITYKNLEIERVTYNWCEQTNDIVLYLVHERVYKVFVLKLVKQGD